MKIGSDKGIGVKVIKIVKNNIVPYIKKIHRNTWKTEHN